MSALNLVYLLLLQFEYFGEQLKSDVDSANHSRRNSADSISPLGQAVLRKQQQMSDGEVSELGDDSFDGIDEVSFAADDPDIIVVSETTVEVPNKVDFSSLFATR